MAKFEMYFIVDKCPKHEKPKGCKEDFYDLCAALLIEEKIVFQNNQSCCIIHFMAAEFNYEETHHLKTLLYEVFSQKHLREEEVVFIY